MKVMIEVVVSTVEGVLVDTIVAVVLPVQRISLAYAMGGRDALLGVVARDETSHDQCISAQVLREVITDAPTGFCKILHLSC